jgi:hypothetical protein
MAKKKIDENEKPRVHKDLQGFDIQINSFGEITTSFDIDKINQFLNRVVDDKKLRHRNDLKTLRGEAPTSDTDEEAVGESLESADDDTDLTDTDQTDTDDLPNALADDKLFAEELDEDDLKS